MTVVHASIDLGVAPERVWEVIMDPKRFGDWVTIHRKVLHVDAGELREGFRVDQLLALAGVQFQVHWTLAELDPPGLGVWHGTGPARSHARIENHLATFDGGTRFHYVNEYRNPGGLVGGIAARVLVSGLAEREAKRSLARLKNLLEER